MGECGYVNENAKARIVLNEPVGLSTRWPNP